MVQTDVTHTAGVRNVTFRDIDLEKPRRAFSIHFDNDRFSRSYYPGAEIPVQRLLVFDDIRFHYGERKDFLEIETPVDAVTISNCSFQDNPIEFRDNNALPDYLTTMINISGCVFNAKGPMDLLVNQVNKKRILLNTSSNTESSDDFSANVEAGPGTVTTQSDLPGLK
jgi:hypothetical protein